MPFSPRREWWWWWCWAKIIIIEKKKLKTDKINLKKMVIYIVERDGVQGQWIWVVRVRKKDLTCLNLLISLLKTKSHILTDMQLKIP